MQHDRHRVNSLGLLRLWWPKNEDIPKVVVGKVIVIAKKICEGDVKKVEINRGQIGLAGEVWDIGDEPAAWKKTFHPR